MLPEGMSVEQTIGFAIYVVATVGFFVWVALLAWRK